MRLCGRVPRQLIPRASRAGACSLERGGIGEELVDGSRERGHVPGRHDPAGLEPTHRLSDSAHVVRHRRDARPERPQQSTALVELGLEIENR